jgi:multidrug efflux pump subunit AcrA (membrane-fusion protein)
LAAAQQLPTTARLEAVPIELTMPERYQVTEVLEPIRRLTLIAPSDGVIRTIEVRLGSAVRESQEIAQLDRAVALLRLKLAMAEVKEKQGELKAVNVSSDVVKAQLEAGEARVELAQLELDRCTLRAPFGGRVTALPVCAGQYVLKGTTIAELADVTSLTALQPVDRRAVTVGAPVRVDVEGREVSGKVQAILPLPKSCVRLRELATPFAAALLVVPNPKGDLEAGLRVRHDAIPTTPIANVAKRAVKQEDARSGDAVMVQVIRNEYVTNVPVRLLGDVGPDRVQITGALRESDSLIVSTSVPLLAGTLVRFGEGAANRGVEGTAPNPSQGGVDVGITRPGNPRGRTGPGPGPAQNPAGTRKSANRTPAARTDPF